MTNPTATSPPTSNVRRPRPAGEAAIGIDAHWTGGRNGKRHQHRRHHQQHELVEQAAAKPRTISTAITTTGRRGWSNHSRHGSSAEDAELKRLRAGLRVSASLPPPLYGPRSGAAGRPPRRHSAALRAPILLKQPFDPDKRLSDVCQLDGGEDHGQQQNPCPRSCNSISPV